jgi:2Fe-2S ferredoxin
VKEVGRITWLPEQFTQVAYEELTLTVHAMLEDREHDQLCGGQAECGTCRVRVVQGLNNLTPMTPDERELRAEHPSAFRPDERLACMSRPLGDVVLERASTELRDLRDV